MYVQILTFVWLSDLILLSDLPSTGNPIVNNLIAAILISTFSGTLFHSRKYFKNLESDSEKLAKNITLTPHDIDTNEEDEEAIFENSIRTKQQNGEAHLHIEWPDDVERDWIEVDAGDKVYFDFVPEPHDVKFNGSEFCLNDSTPYEGFKLIITHDKDINSRELKLKLSDSNNIILSRTLKSIE